MTTASTWWKRILWGGAALFLAGLLTLTITVVALYPELPDTSGLANYHPKLPLRVYTADGVEIGGFGTEKRTYLPIQQIPKLMKDSLLAVEDARFYEHHGIDPIGVLRAILSNITGHRTQGASTITQQVART
ncbi:MAG TPA: transglycosylase domain-containing protein, partial [Aquabacterium sp.]|nr:transglycosylase domain-containing protein [Aquabacterium sp.]